MSKKTETKNPFALMPAQKVNAGTIEVEKSRAVQEAQGKLVLAKQFPRDKAQAFEEIMAACKIKALAEESTYSYPRGGKTISGPSIRLAEELARIWGNIEYGIKEMSQEDGYSEMQAFCWDMEKNVYSSQNFTVKHERHTKDGVFRLTDPRDIYEVTANMAGRRLRARIMAVLPRIIIDEAMNQCRKTLIGDDSESLPKRIEAMLSKFDQFKVNEEMIEKRTGKKTSDLTADDLVELVQVYQSIKDNIGKVTDYFGGGEPEVNTEVAQLNAAVKVEESKKDDELIG